MSHPELLVLYIQEAGGGVAVKARRTCSTCGFLQSGTTGSNQLVWLLDTVLIAIIVDGTAAATLQTTDLPFQ